MRETWVQSLGWEDCVEKGKATHSSILAWRIPWTIYSIGSQSVGHDWVTFAFIGFPSGGSGQEPSCKCRRREGRGFDPSVGKSPWRRGWSPRPVFLPREFYGQRSLMGWGLYGHKELNTTEATWHSCNNTRRMSLHLSFSLTFHWPYCVSVFRLWSSVCLCMCFIGWHLYLFIWPPDLMYAFFVYVSWCLSIFNLLLLFAVSCFYFFL